MSNHGVDAPTPENLNIATSDILFDAKDKYLYAQGLDLSSLGKSVMRYVKPTPQDDLDFDLRRIMFRPDQFGNDLINIHPSERNIVGPDRVDTTELNEIKAAIGRTLRRKVLSVYIPAVNSVVFTSLPGEGELPFALMRIDQLDRDKLRADKRILFVESNYAQLFRAKELTRDIFDNELIRQVANGDIDLDKQPRSFLKAGVKTTINSTTRNYADSSRSLLTWGKLISEDIAEW